MDRHMSTPLEFTLMPDTLSFADYAVRLLGL